MLVTGCWSLNLQNWKARSCQMSFCCHWHLYFKEAWRYRPLFPQLWCMRFSHRCIDVYFIFDSPWSVWSMVYRSRMSPALTTSSLTFPRMDLYVFFCFISLLLVQIFLVLKILGKFFRWVCWLIMATLKTTSSFQLMRICFPRSTDALLNPFIFYFLNW